jgi:DNA-binding NarL/FixJ family response regulator
MSGPQLAERVVSLRPRTRVMFVSGHTQDAIGHHGVLDESLVFLHKPFSMEVLATKVREVLGGDGRGAAGPFPRLVSPASQSHPDAEGESPSRLEN